MSLEALLLGGCDIG
jgi:hypothetical protein